MRVPRDPQNPTFDDTEKIGLVRWLTSSGADRKEWVRRRNAAAQAARSNTNARAQQWADRKEAERRERRQH